MQTIKAIITGEKSFVGKNLVKFFKKKKIYYNTYSDFKKSTNQNQFTHLIHISFQKNCNNSNFTPTPRLLFSTCWSYFSLES